MNIKRALSFLTAASIAIVFAGCEAEVSQPYSAPPLDPEATCVSWSSKSCASLAGCCQAGSNFDQFQCELNLSAYCLDGLKLELAHSELYIVDAASVSECLTPISMCNPPEPKDAHPIACANMLTGYRPIGTGCQQTADCERPANGRATCYYGQDGNVGVCAEIVTSTNGKCSFSKETLHYATCPADTYCDLDGIMVPPSQIPSDFSYEFEADCKPYLANGETCVVMNNGDFDIRPCKEGLYCDLNSMDPTLSKCQPYKKVGDPCSGNGQEECGSKAHCDFGTNKCEQDVSSESPFCHAPPKCGDGDCTQGETPDNCIADCGYCGDNVCSADEQGNCSTDCGFCGDGVCSADESGTCPQDCNQPGCVSCADYINNQQMGNLCPASEGLFINFGQCMCNGPCASACTGNFCSSMPPSAACTQCAQDQMNGCGTTFAACANDI